jgi:small conductance mechanosensitive channel
VGLSERAQTAIVTAAAGIALILAVRWALGVVMRRYERRLETRRTPDEIASIRTRMSIAVRVVIAFLAIIVVWQVLAIFPSTGKLANTVIASGAVLALFVGLAFSTPLGNLGAGILLAFTQPVRIGDRVTVGDVTGRAEQITLIHTVLVTDDERRIFVPNIQMVSSVVVNRSVVDPRRWVTVEVPVALGAPLDRAKGVVLEGVRASARAEGLEFAIRVGQVSESTAWLSLTAYAPPTADVAELAGELRERAVGALAREQLLPA